MPFSFFDLKKPFYVLKNFKCNGKSYAVGEVFKWKVATISPRKVRQLFDIRIIGHDDASFTPSRHNYGKLKSRDLNILSRDKKGNANVKVGFAKSKNENKSLSDILEEVNKPVVSTKPFTVDTLFLPDTPIGGQN